MKARTLAIALGTALAVSVGVNLFAATAAYGVLSHQSHDEHRQEDGDHHSSSRELIGGLSVEAQGPVRQALRAAAQRARPEFQASREARRQAILAASAQPMDAARVQSLLDQSRDSEVKGREMLEADAIAILGSLSPADRAAFAKMFERRGRGAGHDRGREETARPGQGLQE